MDLSRCGARGDLFRKSPRLVGPPPAKLSPPRGSKTGKAPSSAVAPPLSYASLNRSRSPSASKLGARVSSVATSSTSQRTVGKDITNVLSSLNDEERRIRSRLNGLDSVIADLCCRAQKRQQHKKHCVGGRHHGIENNEGRPSAQFVVSPLTDGGSSPSISPPPHLSYCSPPPAELTPADAEQPRLDSCTPQPSWSPTPLDMISPMSSLVPTRQSSLHRADSVASTAHTVSFVMSPCGMLEDDPVAESAAPPTRSSSLLQRLAEDSTPGGAEVSGPIPAPHTARGSRQVRPMATTRPPTPGILAGGSSARRVVARVQPTGRNTQRSTPTTGRHTRFTRAQSTPNGAGQVRGNDSGCQGPGTPRRRIQPVRTAITLMPRHQPTASSTTAGGSHGNVARNDPQDHGSLVNEKPPTHTKLEFLPMELRKEIYAMLVREGSSGIGQQGES